MAPDASRRTRPRWLVPGLVIFAVLVAGVLIWQRLAPPVSVEGTTGTEDDLRFELESVDCDSSQVGTSSGVTLEAENGIFCIVRPRVENLEEDRRSLDAECQYLIDRAGNRHTPREDAAELRELTEFLFHPGRGLGPFEVTPSFLALYYDVPTDTEPDAVELHADCGSRGLRFEIPS